MDSPPHIFFSLKWDGLYIHVPVCVSQLQHITPPNDTLQVPPLDFHKAFNWSVPQGSRAKALSLAPC